MLDTCSFRQVEEKHVSVEVTHMLWSPRMDLLALANLQGEVILHRLSWQKVWNIPSPAENVTVSGLAWRPDGKVLAVGYSTGVIHLCDVENAAKLHHLQFRAPVTCLSWLSGSTEEDKDKNVTPEDTDPHAMPDIFEDSAATFLPKLPPFPKASHSSGAGEDETEDVMKLRDQTDLNLLLIGCKDGHVFLYAYGVFPAGIVDVNQHWPGRTGSLVAAHTAADFRLLSLFVELNNIDEDRTEVYMISYDTGLLVARHRELAVLALKFGRILALIVYLDHTIQQMTEAWEDILLEMDSKLKKFADEKHKLCSGTVSNDFLRLLMFGTPSDELQSFLLNDLTDRGLKRLGHSIETSYSNIQKLVLKHVQSVGAALLYHLAEVRGMGAWRERFGALGICEEDVQPAIARTGSMMLKASELQQVIDASIKNFKAFFRWLYVIMKGLADEPVPAELTKMTQQDLSFVAQFLKDNFTEEVSDSSSGFKLEKVGQYLRPEDLTDPPDMRHNPWLQFLAAHPELTRANILYPAQPNKSLVQMHSLVKESIDAALHRCAVVVGEALTATHTTLIYTRPLPDRQPHHVTMFSCAPPSPDAYVYGAVLSGGAPSADVHLVRVGWHAAAVPSMCRVTCGAVPALRRPDHWPAGGRQHDPTSEHHFLDVAFYDANTLSVLLQEAAGDGATVMAQVPLSCVASHWTPLELERGAAVARRDVRCVDVGAHVDALGARRLDGVHGARLAVSGTRHVSCVLFASRRRVRLFLMDAGEDEEDEEEDESVDASRDHSDGGDEDKENSREEAA